MSKTCELSVTVKVTYDGLVSDDRTIESTDAKPIILHNMNLYLGFQLHYCRYDYVSDDPNEDDDLEWEPYVGEEDTCYRIVEGPVYEIKVVEDDNFESLQLGQAWVYPQTLDEESLHSESVVGDRYRYQYRGGSVDWWVWGDCEEHANTIVKLSPWISGNVVEPAGNEGKPRIMVPASNIVEFTIVE